MNSPKVTPKDFFLWLGAVVALYSSIIAFITLLFQYINYAFPDPLSYEYFGDPYSGAIRFSMATLIVMVPVAILLMRVIRNDIAQTPEKNDLWVRRWALVLTLFIAGLAVVGDLITLINYFLGGDLTMRFVLKVLVLLLVAGGVFMHFLADLRGYWNQFPSRAQMVGWGAGAVVVLTIIAGFFIMGTPGQVRLYRFDAQKVSDLQSIQWELVNFWQQKQTLPASLEELEDPLRGWSLPKDPQGNEYRYERTSSTSFRLCATFNAESRGAPEAMPVRAYGTLDGSFEHGAGEACFDRTIDPERYPPYTKGL
ncbi:MAG TPA: DUF5671 domain-containing protein [Candidatus Paceibacterota bacterium]|nr:DUF5671 domain-containing protein [Candidatus Paceibacterota bacterium]